MAILAIAVSPVILAGGLAVLIQAELEFGEARHGVAVAAYFASGAVFATPAGLLAERLEPRTLTRLGLFCSGGSLLGIGTLSNSWSALVLLLCLGGVGGALTQLGVGLLILRGVVIRRQGVAFGTMLAAVPLAALLAGLSLPAVGLTVGWRWPYLLGAALVLVIAAAVPRSDGPAPVTVSSRRNAPSRALITLAVGLVFASAGGTASAAFLVGSITERGFEPGEAGLVLAAGSIAGLVVRVGVGWLADSLGRGSIRLMAALVAIGGVGYAALALSDDLGLIVVFATLAFGGGWGWPGLALLAASRTHPLAPGRALGVVLTGGVAGAVLGPLAFGVVAEHVSYAGGWLLMGAMAALSVVAILTSRSGVRIRHSASPHGLA